MRNHRSEWVARILVFLFLALAVAVPAAGWNLLNRRAGAGGAVELHGRMPENGGWSHETLHAVAGQPLRLRMTSDDVLHSFAIGQSDFAPIDLLPGEWRETELVFAQPGRYTYYCTRWCGRNHWRMRGVIEVKPSNDGKPSTDGKPSNDGKPPVGGTVIAGAPPSAETPEKPLYVQLGINIDAPHTAEVLPAQPPSAARGERLAQELSARLPAGLFTRETYLATSPAQLFQRLRAEPRLSKRSDADLWDLVAYAWQSQTTPERLAAAAQLYATNCAACHSQDGQGDGVMVDGLPAFDHTAGQMGLSKPPDLSDPHTTLGASPALLEGKLLRGGMGTGMPYWGPIFTEDQIDDLVAYVYTFAWKGEE